MFKNKNVWVMFLCLFVTELIFYQTAFQYMSFPALGRMLLIDISISFICSFFTSKLSHKTETVITFIVLLLLGIYAYIELEFKNFIETYYSLQALADGGFRVREFIVYFIRNAKISYYLCFIPSFVYLLYRMGKEGSHKLNKSYLVIGLISSLMLVSTFIFGSTELKEAINAQEDLDVIISHTGINSFLFEDISSLFHRKEKDLDIETIVIEEETEAEEEAIEETKSYKRSFDDTQWKEDYKEENSETIKTIDSYLMNRKIEDRNDMTGIYEGYNFIYFLVESLDYIGFDEVLTPNIWKMMKDGYFFPRHYTPVFSCGTGDSEFVAMTSQMSYGSSCTVYSVIRNDLRMSLGGLFAKAGYNTYEYHNWDDTFYERSKLSKAYGVDTYKDIEDLDIKLVSGWQSDAELAAVTVDDFKNDDRFFVFYVTSTMHWPYDTDSYWGNKHIKEINEVHPEYPVELKRYISKTMEFDRMLGILMEELEEAGKLDKTVFCFWPDHHPFNLSSNILVKYSTFIDRTEEYGYYRSPLIIYNSGMKGEENMEVCSTFDHLPTIANMFNLNYDPRLYIGSDIFNGDCTVIMSNSDWINDYGIYKRSSKRFIPFNEENMPDQSDIDKTARHVKDLVKVGRAMVSNDYFSKREYLTDPVVNE